MLLDQDDDESTPPPSSPPVTVAPISPIGERLLKARTIIISGEITQKVAESVMGQLVALTAESDAMVTMFVNSQGDRKSVV